MDPKESCTRFKGRFVAKGFTHRKWVDSFELFLLVARYSTIWVFLRFLQAIIGTEIRWTSSQHFSMRHWTKKYLLSSPEVFLITASKQVLYQLKKALYGLKQSSRAWFKMLRKFLNSIDFVTAHTDASFYVLNRENNLYHHCSCRRHKSGRERRRICCRCR